MDTDKKPWILSQLGYGRSVPFEAGYIDEVQVRVSADLWCNLDYKEGVEFYIRVDCENDGACRVTLVVEGNDNGESWTDEHEFEDCFDLKMFLPKEPVILVDMAGTSRDFEELGRALVYSCIGHSTNTASNWVKLLVRNPHEDNALEEMALEFVFGIWEGRESVLSLPWAYASKYFVVPEE